MRPNNVQIRRVYYSDEFRHLLPCNFDLLTFNTKADFKANFAGKRVLVGKLAIPSKRQASVGLIRLHEILYSVGSCNPISAAASLTRFSSHHELTTTSEMLFCRKDGAVCRSSDSTTGEGGSWSPTFTVNY
jgi:hypothetical protein